MGFVVGIDASRNRSGGAKAHLIGIISECDPKKHGIKTIHVWAFESLLNQLPNYPWLIKHNPPELEQSLFKQLVWQATSLAKEARKEGCDILFTTDASTLCFFSPMVVLSQDMLSYEPGVMRYISNAEMYKHQWVVVDAISLLRKRGYNITCTFVGGGEGPGQKLLQDMVINKDPEGVFINQLDFLPHSSLPELLKKMNLFIFASSCENMPVTLIEGMTAGLPIACSNRGPMPEVLVDGGVYFDPENAHAIANAIEKVIKSPTLRLSISDKAKKLAQQYNWKRCSDETLSFIAKTYMITKK